MFNKLTSNGSTTINVLFFVDKDLSEICQESWPTDDRIYVTDVYSIENYFVSRQTFERLCTDFVKIKGFEFDFRPVTEHFDEQLRRFHRQTLTIMAWIVCTRMKGLRPNVNNIDLSQLVQISDDCIVQCRNDRATYLARATGINPPAELWKAVLGLARILAEMEPKTIVRGKFEIWFMVVFFRAILDKLTWECWPEGKHQFSKHDRNACR